MAYYPNLKLWEYPRDYGGADWSDWYPIVGRSRDSDCLEASNFDVATRELTEIHEALGAPDVAGPKGPWFDAGEHIPCLYSASANHWAVGWVETLFVHKDSPEALLQAADTIRGHLEDYPILDEEDSSRRELEDANETWTKCYSVRERAELIRECYPDGDVSIFAARRDYIPEEPSSRLFERMRG